MGGASPHHDRYLDSKIMEARLRRRLAGAFPDQQTLGASSRRRLACWTDAYKIDECIQLKDTGVAHLEACKGGWFRITEICKGTRDQQAYVMIKGSKGLNLKGERFKITKIQMGHFRRYQKRNIVITTSTVSGQCTGTKKCLCSKCCRYDYGGASSDDESASSDGSPNRPVEGARPTETKRARY